MFEEAKPNVAERDRSRMIMALSGLAVVIVVALIIIVGSRRSGTNPDEGWVRAGSPEFNSYSQYITLSKVEKSTTSTLIGRRLGYLHGVLQNTGNKTLVGVRLRAVAVGFSGEVLAERIGTPVPRQHESLAPNQSIPVSVQLDPIPDPGEIQDMTLQIYELKFK